MISGYVSVAHRYWKDDWSVEKNQSIYGSLASPIGVGSNLKVVIEGEGPLETAWTLLKAHLDHKSLDQVDPRFKNSPSTLESIALFIADVLLPTCDAKWSSVTVWELDDRRACRVERSQRAGALTMIENYRNLTLTLKANIDPDSLLALSRNCVANAVDQVFLAGKGRWDLKQREALEKALPGLVDVAIDLGRQLGEPSDKSALKRCI